VSFLTGQGWSVDSSASEGSGWRAHLHKGGLYVNMRAAEDELIYPYGGGGYHDSLHGSTGGYGIGIYLGTGYDGGDGWDEQAGAPVRVEDATTCGVGANLPPGSVAAYHLFDDGNDNIIVVVERSPGIFCYFGWGPDLEDAGQPEAFPYFFGSSPAVLNTYQGDPGEDRGGINVSAWPPMSHGDREDGSKGITTEYHHAVAYVRVDAATFTDRWVGNNQVGIEPEQFGHTGRVMRCACSINPDRSSLEEAEYPCYEDMTERVHQTAFAGALLLPLHCFVRTDPADRWAPIGYPANVFYCEAVGHGYAAGTVYQVGGLDYMLFPHFAVRKGA